MALEFFILIHFMQFKPFLILKNMESIEKDLVPSIKTHA